MKKKQQFSGVIVSDAMQKTVVVEVTRFAPHPRYHKRIRIRKRFKAHDEENQRKVGDKVIIEATRPISKEKHWLVIEKISNDKAQMPNLSDSRAGQIQII